MLKSFKSSLMILVAIAMATLSSCSSKDMLDLIPADIDFVAVGNPEQFIKNAGFEVTATDIKGPSELKAALNSIPNKERETLTALYSSIDAKRMVVMGYIAASPEVVALVKVTDKDKFGSTLRSDMNADRSTVKGFDVYELGYRSYIVVDGSYAYISGASSADDVAAMVNKFINRAKDKDITSVASVTEYISGNNTLNIVCNMTPLAELISSSAYNYMDTNSAIALSASVPYLKGNWLSISADYAGSSLTVKSLLFNQESGKKVEYPGLKKIDTDALKLLPADAVAAVACGVDNQALRKQLSALQPMVANNPITKELIKHIGNIDGTIAMGMGISNEQQLIEVYRNDPTALNNTIVAGMLPGKAEEFKTFIANAANLSGLTVENQGAMTVITDKNVKVYVMVKGNDLIISNSSTVEETNNNLISMISGASSAIAVNVPSIAKFIGGNSKLGFEGSLTFKDNVMTFNIEVTGAKEDLYSALLSLGSDIQAFKFKMDSSAPASDYAHHTEPDFTE